MIISKVLRQIGIGGLAIAAAAISATAEVQPAQAGILERLNMLEAAGSSSESGAAPISYDLAVIDTMIEQLMEMSETAMVGMMSDDPEIAAMSEAMMEMIEAELEELTAMRSAKLSELLPMLRSTSPESGVER
ncbi:MAG: hypothetical protein AB4040_11545 [Synechococcus sp.]